MQPRMRWMPCNSWYTQDSAQDDMQGSSKPSHNGHLRPQGRVYNRTILFRQLVFKFLEVISVHRRIDGDPHVNN